MTGFGTGRSSDGERVFLVEVRSVNHKFCDVRTRVPRELSSLEGLVQTVVRRRVARGRVDVSIDLSYAPEASRRPKVNAALALGYKEALEDLSERLGLSEGPSLGQIVALPGVIEVPEQPTDLSKLAGTLELALSEALDGLDLMRDGEGRALSMELNRLLEDFAQEVAAIQDEMPAANAERKKRLEQRLAELVGDERLDPVRLAQETAILVDRSDVTEEMARLDSHCAQFREMLGETEPVGRKLDFLLQEMQREANTIGSKSASARISHRVVSLKSAVERLREQVQNVE